MKSLKTLVSLTALTVCMGAASMVNAATISPPGAGFTTPAGAITVTSPASFGAPVACTIVFTGSVAASGANASITGATVSGSNPLCGVPVLLGLPWTLTASTATGPDTFAGTVSGVNFKIVSNCASAPATINVVYNNSNHTITVPSAQTVGSCKITALNATPTPTLTVNP
ncbi:MULTISPECIES: alkane oxidation protein activator PraB [Pseudomonas]|jgi:hypothetical protein|uniref:Protein activator n=1 Tax=Pseudomonas fluorescens LMG 5329 TaxID=1324332 RepID=A0A0A1Z3K4_PSEFL|nr:MULTISPECIES: alkane oxidation protein activator PraB [Pseudomonas]KGE68890.1 protein activator [Pseudomonas fluorescens LMG 5329]NWC75694.1 protein activator [Pseudomonas sp. P7759]NWE01365.1 protein activator [Pseudomonas sp. IPO3749]NWF19964.1 protein activator [Pseudomonas sp. IPO3749]